MKQPDDKIQLQSSVRKIGGSLYMLVKPELADKLDLEDGDTVEQQLEMNQFGKYGSFWNPEQQKNGEE